jgi:hypothetical protein
MMATTAHLKSRIARLEAKAGVNQERLFFRLFDWPPDARARFSRGK